MAHDLDDNVNQSFSFSILLNNISILLIALPFFKNSLFPIVSKITSFSSRLKILSALRDDCGIIGYNKKVTFLTISRVV